MRQLAIIRLKIGIMKYVSFLFIVFLVSCSENYTHKEISRDFPQNRWQKDGSRKFDFVISDTVPNYKFDILLTHIENSQYDLIPLQINLIDPQKNVTTEQVLVRIKDSTGNDLGDCVGDYCDVEVTVLQNKRLNKGKYSLQIQNKFPGNYLPNVIALGVLISESEAE